MPLSLSSTAVFSHLPTTVLSTADLFVLFKRRGPDAFMDGLMPARRFQRGSIDLCDLKEVGRFAIRENLRMCVK